MTPEEQRADEEEYIRFQEENPDYWGIEKPDLNQYTGYKFDEDRLRENLKLTPGERLDRAARRLAVILEEHGDEIAAANARAEQAAIEMYERWAKSAGLRDGYSGNASDEVRRQRDEE